MLKFISSCILILSVGHGVLAQGIPKTQKVTIEAGPAFTVPVQQNKHQMITPNYGASIMVLDKIGLIGFGFGLSSSSNNYKLNEDIIINGANQEVTRKFTSRMDVVHLILVWGMLEEKKWNINPICGLSINSVQKADFETYLASGEMYDENLGVQVRKHYGNLNGGLNISKQLNSKWSIIARPMILLSYKNEEQDWRNSSPVYPIAPFKWHLDVRIGYLLFQKDLYPKKKDDK